MSGHRRRLLIVAALLVLTAAACEQAQKSWRNEPPPDVKIAREGRPGSAGLEVVEGNVAVTVKIVDQEPAAISDGVEVLSSGEWDSELYRALVVRKLSGYWLPKLEKTMEFRSVIPGRTVFRAVVNRDGALKDLELTEPSGSEQYDLTARDSIEQPYPGLTTEFRPLPEEFVGRALTLEIVFYAHTSPQPQEEKKR
jgi:hypothetical protein